MIRVNKTRYTLNGYTKEVKILGILVFKLKCVDEMGVSINQ